MVNYSNGKIYKILDLTNGNFYIGSTTKTYLSQRLEKHRTYYKAYLNGNPKYISSMEILHNEDYKILLLENFSCNSKDELTAREQYWMDILRCDKMVNKHNAKGLNIEKKKEYDKKYREDNKDKRVETTRKWRQKNKIQCDRCNSVVNPDYYKKHRETKSCINALPHGIINLLDEQDEQVITYITNIV